MATNLLPKDMETYRPILDNLLDIGPNDNAIFCRPDNKEYFDVHSKFGPELMEIIYSSKSFEIPVLEHDQTEMIENIQQMNDKEQLFELYPQIGKQYAKDLKQNFEKAKEKIIDVLEVSKQKSSIKWKEFSLKAEKINAESNIWSMYVGFMFISLSTSGTGKKVHAPLFLKEVRIEFKNSNPYLISNGTIKVNEKLFYFLQNERFNLDINTDLDDLSIQDIIENIKKTWGNRFAVDTNIIDKTKKIQREDIQNEKILFHKGMILGIFQPLGGYLRNRMIEIIKSGEMENILDVDIDKNIYAKRINETIYKDDFGFVKITHTNFSQDKAIVSSLNQHTIIWGPPGTGKSQTIVNILANILAYEKTALVVSQKKAALEVIEKRLGRLSKFCLFLLNNRKMSKEMFYEPIKNYIELIENLNTQGTIEASNIINTDEMKYISAINKLSKDPNYFDLLELNGMITMNSIEFNDELFAVLRNHDSSVVLPDKFNWSQDIKKAIYQANNIKWFNKLKADPKIKIIEKLLPFLYELRGFEGNFNRFIELVKKFKNREILTIMKVWSLKEKISRNSKISNDKDIELFVLKKIFNKIMAFDDKKKALYKQFATAARLASVNIPKFLKTYSPIIKELFPVIVTTPDTDLSAWEKEEFDYAIMDECSQMFIEKGLPALYLAKIKILAGDDKQMQPTRWFSARSDSDSPFGETQSMLEHAISIGIYKILLDKNYRSNYADLMTFSSKNFYNSSLDIVDLNKKDKRSSIEVIEANGQWDNSINQAEIDIMIAEAQKNLKKYNKIILLTFNSPQSELVQKLILENYPDLEEALHERKIMIKNIENIQGDEADLVIISVVYDKNVQMHVTYVGRPGGKNALNVAITRAKDKMIIIKSINSRDIKNSMNNPDAKVFREWLKFLEASAKDRRNYIQYNDDVQKTNIEPGTLIHKIKTHLEKHYGTDKLQFLTDYRVGTQKIDLAVIANNRYIVGIKVDENNYGLDFEKYMLYIDKIKFLNIRQYRVTAVDNLLWYSNSNKIISWIDDNLRKYSSGDLSGETVEWNLTSESSNVAYEPSKTEVLGSVTALNSINSTQNYSKIIENIEIQEEIKPIETTVETNIEYTKEDSILNTQMLNRINSTQDLPIRENTTEIETKTEALSINETENDLSDSTQETSTNSDSIQLNELAVEDTNEIDNIWLTKETSQAEENQSLHNTETFEDFEDDDLLNTDEIESQIFKEKEIQRTNELRLTQNYDLENFLNEPINNNELIENTTYEEKLHEAQEPMDEQIINDLPPQDIETNELNNESLDTDEINTTDNVLFDTTVHQEFKDFKDEDMSDIERIDAMLEQKTLEVRIPQEKTKTVKNNQKQESLKKEFNIDDDELENEVLEFYSEETRIK